MAVGAHHPAGAEAYRTAAVAVGVRRPVAVAVGVRRPAGAAVGVHRPVGVGQGEKNDSTATWGTSWHEKGFFHFHYTNEN